MASYLGDPGDPSVKEEEDDDGPQKKLHGHGMLPDAQVVEEINPYLPPNLSEAAEPPSAAGGLAAEAGEASAPADQVESIAVADLRKLRETQREQSRLLADMRSAIDRLTARQTHLEDEIKDLRGGRWVVRAEPAARSKRGQSGGDNGNRGGRAPQDRDPLTLTATSGIRADTDDLEIDAIISSRRERRAWPLKRKYCTSFTKEVELLKIRFHRSAKHQHKSVRIPKVDKSEEYGIGNKEGRLICRLCSGKTINRNTSYMCATCLVPLCVDTCNGDAESSCHSRWHSCRDLISVNFTLNQALRERRASKKRSREAMSSAEAVAVAVRAAAGAGAGDRAAGAGEGGVQQGVAMQPLEVPHEDAIQRAAAMVPPEVPPPLPVDNPMTGLIQPKVEAVETEQPKEDAGEIGREQPEVYDPHAVSDEMHC